MPATPTIFSARQRGLEPRRSELAGSVPVRSMGRLAALIDLVAPEGYEDETGFHLLAIRGASNRARLAEPVWLDDHI